MKKLLIIPMLIVCFVSYSQTKEINKKLTPVNSASIIGKSIRIGSLEVAQNDFPDLMKWDDAKKSCAALGSGWRLPTKQELNTLYKNKDKIDGFALYLYWSSEDYMEILAWYHNFAHDIQAVEYKFNTYSVRAVRTF